MVAWATAVLGSAGQPGRGRYVLLPGSSTVEVAASALAVHLWAQLALQLRQAPDPGAVGAEVGLDLGGQLAAGVAGAAVIGLLASILPGRAAARTDLVGAMAAER